MNEKGISTIIRPSIAKVAIYAFTKYLVFFFILAFMDNRFKSIVLDNAQNTHEIITRTCGYIVEVVFGVFFLSIILIIPVYLLFKLHNLIYFLSAFISVIVAEYFLYEGLASSASYTYIDKNGIVNCLVSVVVFLLFFWKFIMRKNYSKLNSTSDIS